MSARSTNLPAWILVLLVAIIGGMLAWLSVQKYLGYNTLMLDLGNMTQSIASVLRGEPLLFTYKTGQTSRLALHVELFYFLLVPFYALFPDPRTLLIIQAALMASAAIPVYALASQKFASNKLGLLFATLYLLYPVAQTPTLHDFHGDALAMPLLLWALAAWKRQAWRSYALWIGLALACKVYVALPVILLGFVLWRWGDTPRAGIATSLAGVGYGLVAFLIIRPLFTTGETSEGHRGLNYLTFYFGELNLVLDSWEPRLLNLLIVFLPAILLILPGWRWLIPGLPLAAAALLSNGPGPVYDYRHHHFALVVPFLMMAMIDGASRIATVKTRNILLILSLGMVLGFNLLLVNTPLSPILWNDQPNGGLDSSVYTQTSRDEVKDRFLEANVPAEASIMASSFLASHLANRETLYSLRYTDIPTLDDVRRNLPRVDYVVADALLDWRVVLNGQAVAGLQLERAEIGEVLRYEPLGLVAMRDGLLLFARNADPSQVLQQEISQVERAGLPAVPADLGPVQLLGATLEPIGERRYRAQLEWQLTAAPPDHLWVAVSRIGGRDDLRIVHLPSYALLPITEWQPGQMMRETIEFTLPADLPTGTYDWTVAWYDATHPEGHQTNARSLPPGIQPIVITAVSVP